MLGARDTYIHWAQEMFDQAGMLREIVKWDYELRNGDAARNRDRPRAVAGDQRARGPGLSVACRARCWPSRCPAFPMTARRGAPRPRRPAPTTRRDRRRRRESSPRPRRPLIITASAGRDPGGGRGARRFRRAFRDPGRRAPPAAFVAARPTIPCHLGYDPTPVRRGSRRDPRARMRRAVGAEPGAPPAECRVIHLGVDPLCARYPIRGFRAMSRSPARARLALPELGAALKAAGERRSRRAAKPLAERRDAQRAGWRKLREEMAGADADPPGLGQPLPQRGARPELDPRQRIHVAATSIARSTEPRLAISGRARRRGSAGAPARRSGSSSRSRSAR